MTPEQKEKISADVARGIELREQLDKLEHTIETKLGEEIGDFGEVWHAGAEAGPDEAIAEIEEQI